MVQDLLDRSSLIKFIILSTLSLGKRHSIFSESKITPKYSRQVHGPSNLFSLSGIPRLLKICSMDVNVNLPSESGLSIVRKSSNRCSIHSTSYLLMAIQHTAYANVSNILGDDRQPNASLVRT